MLHQLLFEREAHIADLAQEFRMLLGGYSLSQIGFNFGLVYCKLLLFRYDLSLGFGHSRQLLFLKLNNLCT